MVWKITILGALELNEVGWNIDGVVHNTMGYFGTGEVLWNRVGSFETLWSGL